MLALAGGKVSFDNGIRFAEERTRLAHVLTQPVPRHFLTEAEGIPGAKSPYGEVLVTGVPITSGSLRPETTGRQFLLLGPQAGEGAMIAMVFHADDLPRLAHFPRDPNSGAVTIPGLVSDDYALQHQVYSSLGSGELPSNLYVVMASFEGREARLAGASQARLRSFLGSIAVTMLFVVAAGTKLLAVMRGNRVHRPAPTRIAQAGPWGGRRQPPTQATPRPPPKAAPRPPPKPMATGANHIGRFARSPIESRRRGFWGWFSR